MLWTKVAINQSFCTAETRKGRRSDDPNYETKREDRHRTHVSLAQDPRIEPMLACGYFTGQNENDDVTTKDLPRALLKTNK